MFFCENFIWFLVLVETMAGLLHWFAYFMMPSASRGISAWRPCVSEPCFVVAAAAGGVATAEAGPKPSVLRC